jgi:hypothetical protein
MRQTVIESVNVRVVAEAVRSVGVQNTPPTWSSCQDYTYAK